MFDRVPAERLQTCLEELGQVLAPAKAMIEIQIAVAKELAAQEDIEIPDGSIIYLLPDELEWVDDGERNLGAEFCDGEKSLAAFKFSSVKP